MKKMETRDDILSLRQQWGTQNPLKPLLQTLRQCWVPAQEWDSSVHSELRLAAHHLHLPQLTPANWRQDWLSIRCRWQRETTSPQSQTFKVSAKLVTWLTKGQRGLLERVSEKERACAIENRALNEKKWGRRRAHVVSFSMIRSRGVGREATQILFTVTGGKTPASRRV
jgi:hypothetical protein